MAKEKDLPEKTSSFTVDNTTTNLSQMPSVTKLLNRKSLSLAEKTRTGTPLTPGMTAPAASRTSSSSSLFAPPPLAPGQTPVPPLESPAIRPSQRAPSSASAPSAPSGLKIQPTTRKHHAPQQNLQHWELLPLQSGTDPLGRGIAVLFKKGATQALFLSATSPSSGANAGGLVFTAAAAVQPQGKLGIWTGLTWNPQVVPDTWNALQKMGSLILAPPAGSTSAASDRNGVRSAFGILPEEWLLLVRVGPSKASRGIVAFVSSQSLANFLSEALPFLSAPHS